MRYKNYFDYWEYKFNQMSSFDKRSLGIPILGTGLWFIFGIIFPNLIVPISYFFEVKLIMRWRK